MFLITVEKSVPVAFACKDTYDIKCLWHMIDLNVNYDFSLLNIDLFSPSAKACITFAVHGAAADEKWEACWKRNHYGKPSVTVAQWNY